MAEEGLRPIIVKRIKKNGGGHHGGAWKIAYADFVTAMMAFFLLMWLLGSTTKGDLNGISEYFKTPLKVAMQGGAGSGDSSSVIQGGGNDLTRRTGQVRASDDPTIKKTYNLPAAKAALEAEEKARLQTLRQRIEMTIDTSAQLQKFKNQLLLDFTSEGLRIQIVDEKNRPMFALAKADLQPYTREILEAIAPVLNDVPNKIGLSGHTDSTPYFSETGYSNWELSADRANASRRALVRRLATSDPPLGSVIASAEIFFPDSTSGSTRAFISGRAARAIGGEPMVWLIRLALIPPAPARASSCEATIFMN